MNQKDVVDISKRIAADANELKKMIRGAHEDGAIIRGPVMDELRQIILESISDIEVADGYLHMFQKVGKKNYRYFPTNHIIDHCGRMVIETKIPFDIENKK